jgi:hypothetical protein
VYATLSFTMTLISWLAPAEKARRSEQAGRAALPAACVTPS